MFPGRWNVVSQAYSGHILSSPESLTTCRASLQWKVKKASSGRWSRKDPDQIPKPPTLDAIDTKKHWVCTLSSFLMSEFLTLSLRLNPASLGNSVWLLVFFQFRTIGESWNIEKRNLLHLWRTNALGLPVPITHYNPQAIQAQKPSFLHLDGLLHCPCPLACPQIATMPGTYDLLTATLSSHLHNAGFEQHSSKVGVKDLADRSLSQTLPVHVGLTRSDSLRLMAHLDNNNLDKVWLFSSH